MANVVEDGTFVSDDMDYEIAAMGKGKEESEE